MCRLTAGTEFRARRRGDSLRVGWAGVRGYVRSSFLGPLWVEGSIQLKGAEALMTAASEPRFPCAGMGVCRGQREGCASQRHAA